MESILDIYRKNHPIYNDFTNKMQELVTTLLLNQNVPIHSVVSRIKAESSLKSKIGSGRKKYSKIEDITDLCGLRVITYFEDDVDQVAEIIRKELAIDPIHSIDKRKILPANQFGYLSVHFVASLTSKQLQLSKYKKLKNLKIEIQICSILQHAWAEIEHDLEYKSQIAVSYDVRRRFSRLAGLLEIADLEFTKLRDDLQPSYLPVPKRGIAPVIRLPQKNMSITKLGIEIAAYTELTQLKKVSGYTFMSIILILLTIHLLPITHFLSPIVALLKADRSFLFSLINHPALV